jgi:hypothetical protein
LEIVRLSLTVKVRSTQVDSPIVRMPTKFQTDRDVRVASLIVW